MLLCKDAGDHDSAILYPIEDDMAPLLHPSQRMPFELPRPAHARMLRKPFTTFLDPFKITVRLRVTPVSDREYNNIS